MGTSSADPAGAPPRRLDAGTTGLLAGDAVRTLDWPGRTSIHTKVTKILYSTAMTSSLYSVTNDVRRLREERGLSQGQLAVTLCVSRQTVNAIETGRYLPSLPLAFTIARLFGRRIEEIFHDERHV